MVLQRRNKILNDNPVRECRVPARYILMSVLACAASFYIGTITSFHLSNQSYLRLQMDFEVQKQELESLFQKEKLDWKQKCSELTSTSTDVSVSNHSVSYFPPRIAYAKGMASIDREDFLSKYDFGSPEESGSEPLIIYNYASSIPNNSHNLTEFVHSEGLVSLDVDVATSNCDEMNVVTIPMHYGRMCTVLVQNFENYHMQKWMRRAESGGHMDPKQPLRYVNRGMTDKGGRSHRPPNQNVIEKNWEMLKTYFQNFHEVFNELKPILDIVAKDNTIIVLTCNHGQSELLMNFVCNSKAKGLDIRNVLVFPTDKETKDLAEGLGLTTYHDERNFGALPSGAARSYGDRNFVAMMFAKVVCVQLVNYLGFDLLFQDVDVVWYKNPLEWFQDKENPYHEYDMYFQDDGAHSIRYAPYSANSGFYFVRSNDLTRYFFTSLLYHNDEILTSNSHQQVLIQIMAEHASKFGLRVKVLGREMEEFPGGWHYHSRAKKSYLKAIMSGEVVPYIFHMSWTKNKDNKIKFFQQMGEWYLADKCISKTKGQILGEGMSDAETPLMEPCCIPEPLILCHYKDKPSKIPCKESPPIDKGGRSFW